MTLRKEKIENFSGFKISRNHKIETLKKNNYFIIEKEVGGDAPKEFIKLYEYGEARKINSNKWSSYIAKTGNKWYPIESITELLLNKIGEILDLTMANSKIVLVNNQLRFLSKYFLKNDESLVHGAEIYSSYLSGDKDFVHEIEAKNQARDLFTIEFTEEAIKSMFPKHGNSLLASLHKMLIFDAIVGNNDRHFYNWGIITSINNNYDPQFAPIYDTARGLFWNQSESRLEDFLASKTQLVQKIEKYSQKSTPKIGLDGKKDVNHFDIIEHLAKNNTDIVNFILLLGRKKQDIFSLINDQFIHLLSKNRRVMILHLLEFRINEIERRVL